MDVDRIEAKIDRVTTGAISVSDHMGGVMFRSVGDLMDFAKLMAVGGIAVRKHLRGNVGTCLAVCVQAVEWKVSPFALANKSYEVNDQLAYESQLVHAVIEARAPLQSRLRCEYTGEGPERRCTVKGLFKGEKEPHEYTTQQLKDIQPKNSPLWKTDPDQQLFYRATLMWARKWAPDVILGIYTDDETAPEPAMKDITPKGPDIASRLQGQQGQGFSHDNVVAALDQPREVPIATGVQPAPPATAEPVKAEVIDPPKLARKRTKKTDTAVAAEVAPQEPAAAESQSPVSPPKDQGDVQPAAADPVVEADGENVDEEREWLDERIAEANNVKTLAALEELDPRVYRYLRDRGRTELNGEWDRTGYLPNRERLRGG